MAAGRRFGGDGRWWRGLGPAQQQHVLAGTDHRPPADAVPGKQGQQLHQLRPHRRLERLGGGAAELVVVADRLAGVLRDALTRDQVGVSELVTTLRPYARRYGAPLGDGEALLQRLIDEAGVPETTREVARRADPASHDVFEMVQSAVLQEALRAVPALLAGDRRPATVRAPPRIGRGYLGCGPVLRPSGRG
jgi:hypothetical protein